LRGPTEQCGRVTPVDLSRKQHQLTTNLALDNWVSQLHTTKMGIFIIENTRKKLFGEIGIGEARDRPVNFLVGHI
jgi:hypothetical protein